MKYLILFLLSFDLAAQCKIKVDEFTHKESVESKLQHLAQGKGILGIGDKIQCQFNRLESTKYLTLFIEGDYILTTEKGETLYLKFIDDSVMELYVEKTTISDYFSTGGWYYWLYFTLNDSQISKLSTTKIKKIRVNSIDYLVSKRNNTKLMEQIECVLNAKNPKN